METIIEPNYTMNPPLVKSHSVLLNENDFWDDLPQFVKNGILESQEQFNQGKFTKFSEVKASILARKHRQ